MTQMSHGEVGVLKRTENGWIFTKKLAKLRKKGLKIINFVD